MVKKIILEYKKLVNKIIKHSYPTLKNKKFYVIELNLKKFGAIAWKPLPKLRIIIVSTKYRKKERKYKVALLAHELAHFETFEEEAWIISFFKMIPYALSKRYRKKVESDTDKRVIKKGYAKELFELSKKYKTKTLKEGYLKPEEIKLYAQKIGKWKN